MAITITKVAVALDKGKFFIIFLWLALGLTSSFFALKFVHNTTQAFTPPPGTQGADALQAMKKAFPEDSNTAHFSFFLESKDPSYALTNPNVSHFLVKVNARVQQLPTSSLVHDVANYFLLSDIVGAKLIANGLITENATAMAAPLSYSLPFTSKKAGVFGQQLVHIVQSELDKFPEQPPPFTAGVNGLPIFITDIIHSIERDMGMMDAVVMPIALAVMGITIRSLRLMILPVLSIGLTLVCSFALMYPVSLATDVSASTPSLMMSLCIAMSIDYNLFMLSRYMEELRRGTRGTAVIETVLKSSGRTVFISGSTLMISFMGLILFPLSILRSFGYGCGLAIFIAMAVSLTLIPAMILTFQSFFDESVVPIREQWLFKKCCCCCLGKKEDGTGRRSAYTEEEERSILGSKLALSPRPAQALHRRTGSNMSYGSNHSGGTGSVRASDKYYRFTDDPSEENWNQSVFYKLRHILRFPWNFIVLVVTLGIVVALGLQTLRLETTDSFLGYLPRGTQATKSFKAFASKFGYGYSEPYNVLFTYHPQQNSQQTGSGITAKPVLDSDFFEYAKGFLQKMTTDERLASLAVAQFVSVFGVNTTWFTHADLMSCVNHTAQCNPNIEALLPQSINADKTSVLAIATLPIQPTGHDGNLYYRNLLKIIAEYQNASSTQHVSKDWKIYVSGVGPSSLDAMDSIWKDFPFIMALTGGAVLLVVGIAFKSVVVPLRSLISVAMTEAFIFGVIVLTYQDGIFDWTTWPNLESQGAISFTAPIVAFTVVVGVALDYDIFLLTRIYDVASDKDVGVDTKTAVVIGLCHTGKIITAAGVVMSIAFFGLVMSSVGVLNVLGWFLCIAVLFDTFIVRTLVVPSLMSMMGRWSWWPTRVANDFIAER